MDWLSEHAWALWLGLAAFLGIAELLSLDLVLIMLATGAIGGGVTAALGGPVILQILVAAVVAVGMLALVRPSLVRRLHGGPELRLGHSRLIGARATVTAQISGATVGQVHLDGEIWTAATYDEHLIIEPGATVEVLEIRGATAYVHPLPELDG